MNLYRKNGIKNYSLHDPKIAKPLGTGEILVFLGTSDIGYTLVPGGIIQSGLLPTGVTAGTYGSSTMVPVITVDINGRITAISEVPVSGGGGGSGTVTSVGAGTGMNFTTITGVGNVAIDTSKVPYLASGFSTGLLKWNGSAWVFDNTAYFPNPTGTIAQYIRGDGSLATLPSGGGNSIGELTGDVTAGPATSSGESLPATVKTNLKTGSLGVTVDGVTTVVQPGQTGFVVIPYSGTITGWSISANAVGSIQFDVWKAAGSIPTIANTIVAAAFPTLTADQFITSTTLTGWTTAFAAGDVFGFYVNSASTIKNATLTIRTTRS